MAALTIQMPAMTISDDERTFFPGLGERVAHLRKARSITRVQLAEALGVPQVQRQLESISALPKPKQRALMDVVEALLAQQGR